ncbi:TonB-dependent receptor [Alteromonadaceae bacterium 2753L.S.0a.02]|nr:TonB-dependent receptor [Alteromonadaceae bacterium 2753L.S.0a.02]
MKKQKLFILSKPGVLSLCIAAAAAQAQNSKEIEEEVYVTGYRGSLLNSTEAKRNSLGFTDEVFADDIGKMPSQNLAESLSRIPGVRINREVTGEGQQISVRGLGPEFTKVVMNGNSIAVASDGSLGAGQKGRHVDLDMFPPELFSSLSVNKTTTAEQVEGGVSGYVNMRTIRASDLGDEGSNFRFGVEGAYNEMSGELSPRLNFMYGYSSETFGVLVGVVGKQHKSRTDGYETVGNYQSGCRSEWTVNDDGDTVNSCIAGSTGWNVFNYTDIASADYAATHPGVSEGDVIDLNAVSGLSDEQLDNFSMPYIARPMYTYGDRDTVSGILSLEYTPNEDFELALDVLSAKADRSFVRNELMHIYRRNYMQYDLAWIPENIQLSSDNVLETGTFYNNRVWVGSRSYDEELTYTAIMPSLYWQFNDTMALDVSAGKTESSFDRDEPYILYYGPKGVMTHDYRQEMPTVTHSADVVHAGSGWTFSTGPGAEGDVQGGEFRFQRNSRDTETTTMKIGLSFGEDADLNGIKLGINYDKNISDMTGYTGGDAWTERVENSDLEENFASYVVDSPVTDLTGNGIQGIASVNWSAVKNAVGYNSFQPDTSASGDQFGSTVGDIKETIMAMYVEANGEAEVAGRLMRTNVGVRLVDTEQTVESNGLEKTSDYSRILPSFNAVYDVYESIKLRTSASRSLTRAAPSSMFPNAAWNGSGIDEVAVGNYRLSPFESTNFDFGGEWYFWDLGFVGLNYYKKDITGFVKPRDTQVQFNQLEDYINSYGYEFEVSPDTISQTRLDAIEACGGWDSVDCVTNVSDDVNIEGVTVLTGWEAIWVMPLDMLVQGLGFNASMNKIHQNPSDEEGEIFGISDSANITAYYENFGVQTRLTYTMQEGTETGGGWSPLMADDRTQIDWTISYDLPIDAVKLTVTLDAYNITNEPLRSTFESDGNTFNVRYPGATYTLGVRGSF